MGAVKEVVTALERCPVSAKDLNDLKVSKTSYLQQRATYL